MQGPPRRREHPYLDGPYPRAYAHRGWHVGELSGFENTLAAFHRAVDEGFGYLEIDVHASADGVPVVHHDPMLERTTDGTGQLETLRVAELAEVRVAGRETIPLLERVLTELPRTRFTIELKSDAVVDPVLALLERVDAWDRVCLGSYREARLRRARRLGGPRLFTSMARPSAIGLRCRAWVEALPSPLRALPTPPVRGDLAQLPPMYKGIRVIDAALVATVHRSGREIHVWTVDDPGEMAALLDLGVDGLLSDRPDLLREVLASRGQWVG